MALAAFRPSFNPAPKGKTRAEEKAERDHADERNWLAVCKLVDARDKGRCRVCRRKCSTTAIGMTERAERHHLVPRSRGGADTSQNVALLCKVTCHAARHTHGTLQLSGDADARDPHTKKFNGIVVERLAGGRWAVEKHC